jgi:hypothetical protein
MVIKASLGSRSSILIWMVVYSKIQQRSSGMEVNVLVGAEGTV